MMLVVLGAAATALWYIFVYAQSTTTLLQFDTPVVVVGEVHCANRFDGIINERDCIPVIKDDVGHYFINNTGKSTKLFMSEKMRAEGILVKPEERITNKYYIDGVIVNSTNQQ